MPQYYVRCIEEELLALGGGCLSPNRPPKQPGNEKKPKPGCQLLDDTDYQLIIGLYLALPLQTLSSYY